MHNFREQLKKYIYTYHNFLFSFVEVVHAKKSPADLRIDDIMYDLQGRFIQFDI